MEIWEEPPRALPPDAPPVLAIDGFEGPLDWLLELVRSASGCGGGRRSGPPPTG